MKYLIALLLSIAFLGCDTTSELAPENMKKADQYYAAKDYDVAEYYYGKIPEESPLYKEAQLKLKQIADINQVNVPKVSMEDEAKKVSVFDQSITSNVGGKAPIHTVSLNNELTHKLLSVVLEFSYFDAGKNVIAVKRFTAHKAIPGKSQETFTEIAPGPLDEPFVSSNVSVISADFQ